MNGNATRRFESDASTAEQPTADTRADGKTVHLVNDWRLVVRADGRVEAIETTPNGAKRWSTGTNEQVPPRASYRYGKTIEGILARYAHETRFDRDPNTENGAALRDGIITALCDLSVSHPCDHASCDRQVTHVCHVNAPTGPSTSLVCDDHANERTYVTLYALDTDAEEAGQ